MFVISSATEMDGKLICNAVMVENEYEKAIEKAQDNIAEDFGYDLWEEYLDKMDPEITEESGRYTIRDENCGHKECYLVERLIECLPAWKIEFEDGHKMEAYPEEICIFERWQR
jgi:hypothetical protein